MCEDVRKTLYMLDLENVRWDDIKTMSCDEVYRQGRQALFMVDKMDDSSPWGDEEWETAADLLPYLYQNAVKLDKSKRDRASVLKLVGQLSDQLKTQPDQKDLSTQDLDQMIRYLKNGLKSVPDDNQSIQQVKQRVKDIKVEPDFTPGEKRKWIRLVFFFDPQNNESAFTPEEHQDILYHFKNTHTDKMDTVQLNGNSVYEIRRSLLLAKKMPSKYHKKLLESRKLKKQKELEEHKKVHKELQKSFKELSQEHMALMKGYREKPVDDKEAFVHESNRLAKMKEMLDQRMTASEQAMHQARQGRDTAKHLLENGWKRKILSKYPTFLQQQEVGLKMCGDKVKDCAQQVKHWKKIAQNESEHVEELKEEVRQLQHHKQEAHKQIQHHKNKANEHYHKAKAWEQTADDRLNYIRELKEHMADLQSDLMILKGKLAKVNRWEEQGRKRLWEDQKKLSKQLDDAIKVLEHQ